MKQHEATPKQVQRRTSIAKPRVRRSRTRARRRNVVCRVVWTGQGAVGDADRRVLIPVADLKSRRAEHPANIADKFFADTRAYFCSGNAVLFDPCNSIAVLLYPQIEFGGHANVSDTDRPPLDVVGRQQAIAAPSSQHCRELPAKID